MDDGSKTREELLDKVQELRVQLAAAEQDHQVAVEGLRNERRTAEAQWRQRVESMAGQLAEAASEVKRVRAEYRGEIGEYELQRLLATFETQTEELRAANEELTIQAEELRITNEEMRAQAEMLEHQNQELEHLSQKLETERTFLKTVLEQMPASVVIAAAPAGPILLSNQPANKIWGKPLESFVDLATFWRIPRYHPDGRVYKKEEMPLWRSLTLGEVVLDEEFSLRPKGGSPIHLNISSAPVRDDQGRIVAGVVTHFDITARKRMEMALLESHKHTRDILESISDGFFSCDQEMKVTYFNSAASKLLGRDREEVLGKKLFDTFPEARGSIFEEKYTEALRGGKFVTFEAYFEPEPYRNWYEVRVFPFRGGISVYFQVTTARKEAEKALWESRQDLSRAQAIGKIGSWRLDVQRNELTWSEENHHIFGVPLGTPMTYETFLASVHPEDREYVDRKWREALRGQAYDIEHRIVLGNEVKWVREQAELEFDSQDRLQGGFGTTQDITERKQAEEALRASEERLRLAQEVARIGTFEWNVQSGVNTWTPELEAMYGLPPGEFARSQTAWENLVHPDDRPEAKHRVEVAFETGEPTEGEWRVVWPDGTIHWLAGRWQVLKDDSGKPVRMTGINIDITDRKQAEKALQQSNQRLDLLAETAGQLLASGSPQQVVDALCHKVMTFLDCDVFFNFLVQENAGRLHLNAYGGISAAEAKRIEWLDLGVAICGCAAQEGRRIVAEQVQTTFDPRTEVVKSYGIRAYAAHPLLMRSKVLGTLSFGTRTREHFTPDELALMKAVADQVAVAMDRKRAEEALRASGAQERARAAELQAVLDATPGVIFLAHDPECRLITGSLAAYEMLRQPSGSNLSKSAREGEKPGNFRVMKDGREIPPQELPVQRAAAGQMVRDVELDIVYDDGTIRYLSGNAVPLVDSAGQPQGAVGAFMDVTERKQAEAALKRAHGELEQRVRERTAELRDTVAQLIEEVQERQQAQESLRKQAALLDLAHEAITVRDLDSRVTFWNQGAVETYGWTREQALGQVIHTLFQTRFPHALEEVNQELLETGQWQGELVHTRADGKEIVVASRMALQRDDQGQPVAILEINRDVTDRRQAEEALKNERQHLFAVLERIPAHVALLRQDHSFAYVNGEFIRRFGDPGSKRCYEIVGQKNPCIECQAMEVFHTGKPVVWEWAGPNGDIYQMYDYPFTDTDGSSLVLEMGMDITQRKRAEDQAFSHGRMYRMLSKVNEAIVRVADKDELFRQICRLMMEEGNFLLAWIGLVDPETRLVKAAARYDLNDDYVQNLTIPYDDIPEGRGPTGTAVREGRYNVCNDIATDPRMAPWREPALARGFRSSAAFPLRVGSHVVGALTVYADRPGFFTSEEIALLESLADDLSFALDFMDREVKRRQAEEALRESEERLRYLASQLLHAQENERHRLALELHDDLGQSLMVLKLQLRAIEKTVPADQWRTREECVHSLDYVNGVIHNVRRLARNLRPAVLEDLGLSAALRVLTEEFSTYHEMDISLEVDDIEGLFSRDEEINIYRIFQETLTNIAKHAQARRVNLAIRRQADRVTFRVADDGVGFDLEEVLTRDPAKKGLGLAALEERVYMLGGTQTIRTQVHQGTEVSFVVPLTQNRITA